MRVLQQMPVGNISQHPNKDDQHQIILGAGVEGSLLALALRLFRPDMPFRLRHGALKIPVGLIVPACLTGASDRVRVLLDPLIVRRWNKATISSVKSLRSVDLEICLVSLDQLALEIEESVPAAWRSFHDDPMEVTHEESESLRIVDTRGGLYPPGTELSCSITHRILQLEGKALDQPVLLDTSVERPNDTILQYFPLGGGLTLIRSVHVPLSEASVPSLAVPQDLRAQHFVEYVGGHSSRSMLADIIRIQDARILRLDQIPLLVPSSIMAAAKWVEDWMAHMQGALQDDARS